MVQLSTMHQKSSSIGVCLTSRLERSIKKHSEWFTCKQKRVEFGWLGFSHLANFLNMAIHFETHLFTTLITVCVHFCMIKPTQNYWVPEHSSQFWPRIWTCSAFWSRFWPSRDCGANFPFEKQESSSFCFM